MSDGREWTLRYEQAPMLVNALEKKAHWSVRSEMRLEWRAAFHLLALEQKIPRLDAVFVTVQQFKAKGKLPDPDACQPSVKAAIDGCLVDAGIVPDDSGVYLKGLLYLPPLKGPDALELVITEVVSSVCGGV